MPSHSRWCLGLCRGQIVVGINKKELGREPAGAGRCQGGGQGAGAGPGTTEMFLGHCPLNPAPYAGDAAALGSFLLRLLHPACF